MKTKIYGLLLSGLLLAGCTQTEEVAEQGNFPADGRIRISTQVDAHLTKADPQSYGGSDLALSVDYGAGNRFTVTNRKWTNHGDVWTPASQMLWMDAATQAKVYAYAPFTEGVTAVVSVPFAVQTDQSGGLTASDLVVFKNESFVPVKNLTGKSELEVNFTHALSKMIVSLSYGNQWGNTPPEIAAVKINGMQTALTYDLTDQSLATENTSVASVTTFKNTATEGSPTWEGIVVPQTVAAGTKLVTIELTNGDVYAYTLGTGGLMFDANKQYTINLRVGKDQVDLSGVTVGDWGGTVDLGGADSEELPFGDANFTKRLVENYNIPLTNGFIDPTDPATKAVIEAITQLDVSNPYNAGDDVKIKSLKGIEYFVNLTTLYCNNNQLSSLEVGSLTNLTSLHCGSNQLSSLAVGNLTNLTSLHCTNNQLSSLEVGSLTNLISLICYSNQLSSLEVGNLINLTELYCYDNQLASLEVGSLTNLTSLYCNNNQLSSLAVGNLINLTSLHCTNNQLSSLEVGSLTNLISLICYSNQLSSLAVGNLINLTELYCYDNQLASLEVGSLTDLTALYCFSNQLSRLDISSIIALKSFGCTNQKDADGLSRMLELTLTEVQKDAFSSAITSDVNLIIK